MRTSGMPSFVVAMLALAAWRPGVGTASPELGRGAPDETESFFATAPVPELTIVIAPEDVAKLQADARVYVPFVLLEGGAEVGRGGVKLKGAAGSFREFNDRPALTLHMGKFGGTSKFHGLEKFHLNNSVQDDSLLNEWVCAEIFRGAGCPAARVSHARVRVNDRDLGCYVLKEGFDRAFLARHYRRAGGNFYDGGFCQDLDAELELDLDGGEKERADLKRLAAACGEQDPERRRAALEAQVDVDAFIRLMALEFVVGHWDGYCQNVNNYRVYFEPGTKGRAHVLPHGMDQVFGDPGAAVLEGQRGMLAVAVMAHPPWREAYRAELKRLLPMLDPAVLTPRFEAEQRRVQPALKAVGPELADAQSRQAAELLERIKARAANVREQLDRPEPKPLEFPVGEAVALDGWIETGEADGAVREVVEEEGEPWRKLACVSPAVLSWRRPLALPAGRFRLEADARADGVEPLSEDGAPGRGAGVRISGGTREVGIVGTDRKALVIEFSLEGPGEVVLVLELRAAKGEVRFREGSLKLTRLSEQPGK